jgi:glycosyltransferase involved in cell wall biosynthesis
LSCGRPVIVNRGLGDFDEYLTEFNAGVILNGSENNLRNMAHNLAEILADTETPMRCRALAEKYFDVDKGAQKYLDLYPKILLKT